MVLGGQDLFAHYSPLSKRPFTAETTKPSHFCGGYVLYGGTRRTVHFGEARFSGCLDYGGKFGVPQLVTINKSASYGVRWNRTRDLRSHIKLLTIVP